MVKKLKKIKIESLFFFIFKYRQGMKGNIHKKKRACLAERNKLVGIREKPETESIRKRKKMAK